MLSFRSPLQERCLPPIYKYLSIVIWIGLVPVAAIDWCILPNCGYLHTMCKHPKEIPGKTCPSYAEVVNLTEADKELLLSAHNVRRNRLAVGDECDSNGGSMPEASNMALFTWNSLLEKVARRHSMQCVFEHDKCRNLPKMLVGQNILIGGLYERDDFRAVNLSDLIGAMYSEIMYFSVDMIDHFFAYGGDDIEIGHFTQIIWAKTNQLGCGITIYQGGKYLKYFLVCNYGPAGNIVTVPIYKRGMPCSKCPKRTTCGGDKRYAHLCKADGGKLPDLRLDLLYDDVSYARPAQSLALTLLLACLCFACLL